MRNTANWKKEDKECNCCHTVFTSFVFRKQKYCSISCGAKSSIKIRPNSLKNLRSDYWGNTAMPLEKKEQTRKSLAQAMKESRKGEGHPRFNKNRFDINERTARKFWAKQVFARDKQKCRIANGDCKGQLEAHHILKWSEYPELRFDVNNGITLCHAHHPRGAEEKRLIPTFQELVSVSNSNT